MLIERCVCGRKETTETTIQVDGRGPVLPLMRCRCGVEWLRTELTALEIADYYAGHYHQDSDRHANVIPYKERYGNDRRVAKIRLEAYELTLSCFDFWQKPLKILDVGAANGAFVDECREQGHDAHGVEPDPAFCRDFVLCGGVLNVDGEGTFDVITYHDVLEHVVDPIGELDDARHMLRSGGTIIVDVPDVAVDAGLKHYKLEHLWYFTTKSLERIAHRLDLRLRAMSFPIPGKMVAYLCAHT